MSDDEIGTQILNAAIRMHRGLGPGLLESVYEVVLARELERLGLRVQRQVAIPIRYDGIVLEEGFRADLLIEGRVIVEVKSVESLHNVHLKQLLSYLRLSDRRLGYLLNFGESLMKDGIERIVNGFDDARA